MLVYCEAKRHSVQRVVISLPFLQTEITRISEDLLKLGILHGMSDEEARIGEQPEMLTFANKVFQEYWAAYYASKRLTKTKSKVGFNNKQ